VIGCGSFWAATIKKPNIDHMTIEQQICAVVAILAILVSVFAGIPALFMWFRISDERQRMREGVK
jgi:hypothetical protein